MSTTVVAPETMDKQIYGENQNGLYTGSLGLVGVWEAAALLGIERSRIARWLKEQSLGKSQRLPQPVAHLKCGPVWLQRDILKVRPEVDRARRKPLVAVEGDVRG